MGMAEQVYVPLLQANYALSDTQIAVAPPFVDHNKLAINCTALNTVTKFANIKRLTINGQSDSEVDTVNAKIVAINPDGSATSSATRRPEHKDIIVTYNMILKKFSLL
jgi:hypothetical protein